MSYNPQKDIVKLKNYISKQLKTIQDNINSVLEKHCSEVENYKKELSSKNNIISKLKKDLKDNKFENDNYNKVSIIKNLNQQVHEKNLRIEELKSKNSFLTKKLKSNKKNKVRHTKLSSDSVEASYGDDEASGLSTESNNDNSDLKPESQSELVLIIEPKDNRDDEEDNEEDNEYDVESTGEENDDDDDNDSNEIEVEEIVEEETAVEVEAVEVETGSINSSDESEYSEDEVDCYEKKIRSKIYYVSDDNKHQIYEKMDNGEVGDLLGYLKFGKSGKRGIPVFY